jgi:hypothetical protein
MFRIDGDAVARALCRWCSALAALRVGVPLEHVKSEGLWVYDLIFTLFLVEVVLPFSP